jgi:phage-related minor tail protein
MKKLLLKLIGRSEAVEVEGAEVEMDGKKVPLETLVNSYKAVKAEEEKVALENSLKGLTDDTIVTVDGKEVSVKDLKAVHAAVVLKNAAEESAKKEAEEKADKEKKDAEALKNAEDEKNAEKEKAEKEAEALKNSIAESEKAEAEKIAAAEKAKGEQHFQDLKNAREKGSAPVKLPSYQSQEERLARGKAMWGQEPAATKP